MYKVFIDGQAGTTGLRLAQRIDGRPDIGRIEAEEALRKNMTERLSCIAKADVTFLCLPDEDAKEIVAAVEARAAAEGPGSPLAGCRIIDCSTAHRTAEGWTYGMPEITRVDGSMTRIANPGCYATGFILSVRPLVEAGLVDPRTALCLHSLTGYSGGGRAMIAEYEAPGRLSVGDPLAAPRQYALAQKHKHLPEMQKYAGLETEPVFAPVVCDFYSGMLVSVPLPSSVLRRSASLAEVREILAEYYAGRPLINVREIGAEFSEASGEGFLSADALSGFDDLELFVTGQEGKIEIVTRYDNLGKGASGAAIQNMNLLMGLPEDEGLRFGAQYMC